MKQIKICTVEALEKRILKALKNYKFGASDRILKEHVKADFFHYDFYQALRNLQQHGLIAYNENIESYELVKR